MSNKQEQPADAGPASSDELGLPPLPRPVDCQHGPCHYFTGEQMRAYARAAVAAQEPSDTIIELAEALQVRRILEDIKAVAKLHQAGDMPTPFQAAWQTCCEEIFYRATGEQWHMDEDAAKFARAANDSKA